MTWARCRFESCERAHAPRQRSALRRDAPERWHAACANGGMTRTDNKSLFRGRSVSRAALLEARGRQMRFALTPSEQLLWSRISGRQLGVVFRRQVPLLGRFIADFYAPAVRLVVEVDGAYHAERARADARRDAVLVRAEYRILRFQAESVRCEPDAVVARIRLAL